MSSGRITYERRLSLFDGTMAVVGGIIGAGIFLNPSIVAQRTATPGLTLAAWGAGGAVALIGALCYGELGARRPLAGGSYIYLRDAFGPVLAFLYGWTYLLVVNTGGIAAVAVTFAGYACSLAAWPVRAIVPVAIAAIVLLSGINYRGIRPGSMTVNIFSLLRLLALALLVGAGFLGNGGMMPAGGLPEPQAPPAGVLPALGAALIPVLFAYGGWQHANHIAGEIRNPQRNLPLALLVGVAIVVAVYMLANFALLRVLGVSGLAASTAPAADTMRLTLGPLGGGLIAAGIACSTFGFLGMAIMAGPRIYQAMAEDGAFMPWAARLHPRFRTPARAILFQAGWAVLLTLSGTYAQLLDYVVFGDWIFFGLTVLALYAYRKRESEGLEQASAVRAAGYPILPALFVVAAAFTVASSVRSNPTNAMLGTLLIAGGIPAYYLWRRTPQ